MLIKQNKAALVESADDVEFILGWKSVGRAETIKQFSINFDGFNDDEKKFLTF